MEKESFNQNIDWEQHDRQSIVLIQAQLRYHSDLYYNSTPEWSDEDYDEMYRHLQRLERKYPDTVTTDSPTQIVGAKIRDVSSCSPESKR